MSQLFPSGGQSIGVSASVLLMNIQDGFPLGWTGWIFYKLNVYHVKKIFCFGLAGFLLRFYYITPSLIFMNHVDLHHNYHL